MYLEMRLEATVCNVNPKPERQANKIETIWIVCLESPRHDAQ